MKYHKRFADKTLFERLQSAGAVLIEGTKGCGKTETAMQIAGSVARFDADEQIRIRMEIDPAGVLAGSADCDHRQRVRIPQAGWRKRSAAVNINLLIYSHRE